MSTFIPRFTWASTFIPNLPFRPLLQRRSDNPRQFPPGEGVPLDQVRDEFIQFELGALDNKGSLVEFHSSFPRIILAYLSSAASWQFFEHSTPNSL